jgi:hypothetical protein
MRPKKLGFCSIPDLKTMGLMTLESGSHVRPMSLGLGSHALTQHAPAVFRIKK